MTRAEELYKRTQDMKARGLIPPDPPGTPILAESPCGKASASPPDLADAATPLEPPPCAYEGEYLTGMQRRELNLFHGRNWRKCNNPEKPLGTENVCGCLKPIGCGDKCPGYTPANECPQVKIHPFKPLQWSYGVTTVPERRSTTLPRTLESLRKSGYPTPRLFVDGDSDPKSWEKEFNLQVTCRHPRIRTHGNWVLALYELFIREPGSTRYAIFQDDMVTCRDLRAYLDRCKYPDRGYWNLYTFPENQQLCPPNHIGWYRSNQFGRGAVALIFSREAVLTLLQSAHMMERPINVDRGWKAVDGGIVTALNKVKIITDNNKVEPTPWIEYVHNPSLVQHTGEVTTMGSAVHPQAISFPGEEFSAVSLLPQKPPLEAPAGSL